MTLTGTDTIPAAEPRLQGSTVKTARGRASAYEHLAIWFFILNTISAALFIGVVNRPIYDDLFNISDVHRYASEGVSLDTLSRQVNAPGPTSFLWMATGVHLLGGDELRAARAAALLSWVLLGAGMLIGARYTKLPELWLSALIATLVFPHTATASASVLTEGPAMLFAMLGALLWIESLSRATITLRRMLLAALGGLFMGIAITCRQYDLMLLPAAVLLTQSEWPGRDEKNPTWFGSVILSLTAAMIPVLCLVLAWKGFTSPFVVQAVNAKAGLNLSRPIVSAFYSILYLLPLTFPAMLLWRPAQRWRAFCFAALAGLGVASFSSSLLQPGPLQSLIHATSRVPGAKSVVLGLIAGVATYNAFAVGGLLWERRGSLRSSPPVVFALLAIVFFIAEQFGVGGSMPFFDRYVLELAPFFGLVAYYVSPRLTSPRVLALAFLFVVSQVMLWRHAFGG